MLTIKDATTISQEALTGEVFGIVRLYNIGNPTKLEASAERVLSITYPTRALSQTLEAITERLSGKRPQGTFIFTGGYGTGKSHCLLTLYHLFTTTQAARAWQERWRIAVDLPEGATVIPLHLMEGEEGNPEFLWEPIFQGLAKADTLAQVRDFPTISQFKAAIGSRPTIIIIDEMESWYGAIPDSARKERNLNFLQVLSEVGSDSDHNAILLVSLYGRNEEILGRLGRDQVFLQDLGASEDKAQVIRFRLFDRVDESKAKEVVEEYIRRYTGMRASLGGLVEPIEDYQRRMVNYYPLHPELLDVLFESYSASQNYQNTRGILYLLSSVLRACHAERDILLPADVDLENEEIQNDLFQLQPRLLERCLADIRRTRDGKLAKGLLATILLRSFILAEPGANGAQVRLGALTPDTDINEINRVLARLESRAWFLHRTNGRYVIRAEENLPVSINARAERLLSQSTDAAQQKLAEAIKGFLKGMEAYVYPLEEIPDSRQLKIVVSTSYMEGDQVRKELLFGREWGNTLIFIRPKSGDLARSEEFLLRAQRILVCEEMEQPGQVSPDKKGQLAEYKQTQEGELAERIERSYGEWIKASGRGALVYFRPITCELKVEDITTRVREAASSEVVEAAIMAELEEAKDQGRRFDELRSLFMKQAGRPLLIDPEVLASGVRFLCRSGQVVREKDKRIYDKDAPEILDEMRLYLARYGPATTGEVVVVTEEEEERSEGERVTYVVEGEDATVGVKERPQVTPVPSIVVSSGEHATPFTMVTELEGRLSFLDRVVSITVFFQGKALEEARRLEELLASLKETATTDVQLTIHVDLPEALTKEELLQLLGNLPIPSEGIIRADLGVQRDEPR